MDFKIETEAVLDTGIDSAQSSLRGGLCGKTKAANPTAPITVVIPTYNRPKTLLNTLRSYLSGNMVPEEIVVVDQSPEPFNGDGLGDTHGCTVKVVASPTPSSTLARNVGVREARNDLILFSDDDIEVSDGSMERLSRDMADGRVALVAGVSIVGNGIYGGAKSTSLPRDIAGFLLGMKYPWRRDGYVVKSNMRGRYPAAVKDVIATEWAMGYFFCVRRSLMEQCDVWFDENLKRYAYAEDLDFSMRYCQAAKTRDLVCEVDPYIYVNHLASTEWRTPSEEHTRYFVENRRYISRKIYPKRFWYRAAMNWFDTLFAMAHLTHPSYAKTLLRYVWRRG